MSTYHMAVIIFYTLEINYENEYCLFYADSRSGTVILFLSCPEKPVINHYADPCNFYMSILKHPIFELPNYLHQENNEMSSLCSSLGKTQISKKLDAKWVASIFNFTLLTLLPCKK